MTKRTRRIAHLMLAATAAATLAACAAGKEFQGTPQAGAKRTDTFPTFGHMPKAATTQFTPDEQKQLTTKLDADRKRYAPPKKPGPGSTPADAAAVRKQAQQQTDDALKQIEGSGQEQQ